MFNPVAYTRFCARGVRTKLNLYSPLWWSLPFILNIHIYNENLRGLYQIHNSVKFCMGVQYNSLFCFFWWGVQPLSVQPSYNATDLIPLCFVHNLNVMKNVQNQNIRFSNVLRISKNSTLVE